MLHALHVTVLIDVIDTVHLLSVNITLQQMCLINTLL